MKRLIHNSELDQPLHWNKGWEFDHVFYNDDVDDFYVVADSAGYLYYAGDGSNIAIRKGLNGTPICKIEFSDYRDIGKELE